MGGGVHGFIDRKALGDDGRGMGERASEHGSHAPPTELLGPIIKYFM